MKLMKILALSILMFGFVQCGSNTLVKNPAFKVEKAFYNNWVGGQPGVRGTKVEVHLKEASKIIFDSLYFQGKKTRVEVFKKGKSTQIIAHFSRSKRRKKDLILDVNATKEFENTVPNLAIFPFELKENEAILSYKVEERTVYFKIGKIQKVQARSFPAQQNK